MNPIGTVVAFELVERTKGEGCKDCDLKACLIPNGKLSCGHNGVWKLVPNQEEEK